MVNTLCIAAVLIALATVTIGEITDCSGPNDHSKPCLYDNGALSICAWRNKRCRCRVPDNRKCQLVCTSDISQWCNGMSEGDICQGIDNGLRCTNIQCGKRSKLMCLYQGHLSSNPQKPAVE